MVENEHEKKKIIIIGFVSVINRFTILGLNKSVMINESFVCFC